MQGKYLAVIINTCNRPFLLKNLVSQLKPQLEQNDAIIIVNDGDEGSVDSLRSERIFVVEHCKPYYALASGRNKGARAATETLNYEWGLFLDDDIEVSDSLIEEHRSSWKDQKTAYAGKITEANSNEEVRKKWWNGEGDFVVKWGGSNMSCHLPSLLGAGGYNEKFDGSWGYEDNELYQRLTSEYGWGVEYLKDAVVSNLKAPTGKHYNRGDTTNRKLIDQSATYKGFVSNEKPKEGVAIIIPTCNRPEELLKRIEEIEPQLDKNDEIIVVNDGDWNSIPQIKYPFVQHCKDYYAAASARNVGLRLADTLGYEWALFLDDDDPISDRLVGAHKKAWSDKKTLYNGRKINPETGNDIRYDNWEKYSDNEDFEIKYVSTNMSVHIPSFLGLGAFDESFDGAWGKEDNELALRARNSGWNIVFVKNAEVEVGHAPVNADYYERMSDDNTEKLPQEAFYGST